MENSEVSKQDSLEISGPPALLEGQNFFEQEPFAKIVQNEAVSSGISPQILRYVIRRMGLSFSGETGEATLAHLRSIGPDLLHLSEWRRVNGIVSIAIDLMNNRHIADVPDPQSLNKSANSMFNSLIQYPYWASYINSEQTTAFYRPDGEYFKQKNQNKNHYPIPTYVEWLSRKLARMKRQDRQVLLGIDEVFPTDFGQKPLDTTRATGKNPGWRKWRIYKISNILKEQ